jgi:hypothetical protein
MGYELCGDSPATLRCPAEWSKQRRPGRPKDTVNLGNKSTKPLQAMSAVHDSSVGNERQEAAEKGRSTPPLRGIPASLFLVYMANELACERVLS